MWKFYYLSLGVYVWIQVDLLLRWMLFTFDIWHEIFSNVSLKIETRNAVYVYKKHYLLIASEVIACSLPFLWWWTKASTSKAIGIRNPNSSIDYSNNYVTFFICSWDIFREVKEVPRPWCFHIVDSIWNNRYHTIHSCQKIPNFHKS